MPRKRYIGDPEDSGSLEKRGAAIEAYKPNTDHVTKRWTTARGPKPSLTPELLDKIALLVGGGNTIPVAAAACGCANLWRGWSVRAKEHLAIGYEGGFEEGQSPYVAFAEVMTVAKASWEADMVLGISSGHPQWKAFMDLLSRRLPKYWQEQKSQTVTVKTPQDVAQGKSTAQLEEEYAASLKADNG
jgi:hypothetical protein